MMEAENKNILAENCVHCDGQLYWDKFYALRHVTTGWRKCGINLAELPGTSWKEITRLIKEA